MRRPAPLVTSPEDEPERDHADAFEAQPPGLTPEEAAELACETFGIDGAAAALDSERDQNFRIAVDGASFVLKISNPAEERAALDLQVRALLHARAADASLPLPAVLPTRDGAPYTTVERDGRAHLVHMLTFLPGNELEPRALSPHATHEFGALVGRVGSALGGFFHPAAGRTLLWDVKNTPALRPLLESVEDVAERERLAAILDAWDERVAPVLPRLRAQVVHGDLTLGNVLFDERGLPAAVIDFGDVTHTALVFDLAVSVAALLRGGEDTWETAEAVIRGYGSVIAIQPLEASVLADAVAARLAATLAISAWRVRRFPENAEYITAYDTPSRLALDLFDNVGWDEVRRRFNRAAAPALAWPPPVRSGQAPPLEDLLARRRRALGPAHSPLSYERPLRIVRGEDVWMFDAEGRRYLDAYNNVPSVGHAHPRVVEAIATQARVLNTNTRYLHETALELAERLISTLPPGLDTCFFVNSGSEANDLAWRMATVVTGRESGLVSDWAYHGITAALDPLSPSEWSRERAAHVGTFSPPTRADAPAHEGRAAVDRARTRLERNGLEVAAAFLDSAWTSDGIHTESGGYEAGLADGVGHAGGLFVADEVQAGFARLGSHLWSFERAGLAADFVTLGKPMGNGHPVAAVVTRAEIAEAYAERRAPLFSTFGGNPVSCAAALAVLDTIEDERLLERADDVGAYLRSSLQRLAGAAPSLGDVRGAGLLVGVEVVDEAAGEPHPDAAQAIANAMRDRGVLIGTTGRHGNVLKIRPPLTFGREHADLLVHALADSAVPSRG